jgi:hypothetical protein
MHLHAELTSLESGMRSHYILGYSKRYSHLDFWVFGVDVLGDHLGHFDENWSHAE